MLDLFQRQASSMVAKVAKTFGDAPFDAPLAESLGDFRYKVRFRDALHNLHGTANRAWLEPR